MKHDVGLQCSWSGNFFGIDFDESAIYTDITDAGDDEDEEVEYLKSVKGKFFGIVFDESAIYTDITDAGDEEEPFAGVGGGQGVRGGRILEVCKR